MKKNYFLSLVVSLLVAVTANAADNLVGIYKLSNLTPDQKDALGTIDADAAIRILPGDADAEYYVSGIAGYGCKFPATYDEATSTLTATDQSMYGQAFGWLILYASDMGLVYVDDESLVLTVKDNGTLEISSEVIIANMYDPDDTGMYIPGIILAKDETPTISVSNIIGDYTFTGTDLYAEEYVAEYSMSIKQVEGNSLTINGFMGVDGIQATYIPEVSMIHIATQIANEITITQNLGDIYFVVYEDKLELITPAVAEMEVNGWPMPIASVVEGKAVKEDTDGIENTVAASAATISVSNGAIYVNSAEPVAVQVFNAAGVQVYSDTVANSAITLPHGVYFVKVAGNAKAVSVAL